MLPNNAFDDTFPLSSVSSRNKSQSTSPVAPTLATMSTRSEDNADEYSFKLSIFSMSSSLMPWPSIFLVIIA